MIARAAVVAERAGDGQHYSRLRSQAPVVLRPTAAGVYLVGGAAGPLGGDDVELDVEVHPGATLTVRSAAASVALPGASPSVMSVRARVAAGASLRWLPEPTVLARGCRHRIDATVEVDEGGYVEWREELLLGRHGESPGSVVSRLVIDVGGRPLLRHELALGPDHPGWDSPAVTGGARAIGSLVIVGPCCGPTVLGPAAGLRDPNAAVVLPLDGPGVQVVALAPDRLALRDLLDAGERRASGSGLRKARDQRT